MNNTEHQVMLVRIAHRLQRRLIEKFGANVKDLRDIAFSVTDEILKEKLGVIVGDDDEIVEMIVDGIDKRLKTRMH